MNDKDRNLQHAMTSFAFWGGMLVSNRQPRASDRPHHLLNGTVMSPLYTGREA